MIAPLALSTLSWLALAVAIGAAVLAVLLAAAAVLYARRPGPRDYEEVVRRAVAPLEAAIADLADSFERASRAPASAGETTADVLARAVAEARRRVAADAATIVVDPPGDLEPHVAASGLASEQPPDPAVLRLAPAQTRGIVIAYRHDDGALAREAIRSAVAVPLRTAGGASGTLAAFWRTNEREPGDAELAALEAVAGRVATELDRTLRR